MANIKFSQFSQSTDVANVDFVVGYDGATNVRISPADLVATAGPFLPLAGGTMTGSILLNDNVQLQLGTSADLQFYHDGSQTLMLNNTDNLVFKQAADDKDIIFQSDDGSGGVTTYFKLWGLISSLAVYKDMLFVNDGDGGKLKFGASQDFQIYHDGSDSYLDNQTGNLFIVNKADDKDIRFQTDNGSGGTTTYFTIDGVNELNQFSKNVSLPDNVIAKFGNSSDLQIYHDGSNSYITDSGTGNLRIRSTSLRLENTDSSNMIVANGGGSVSLYYNANKKIETTDTGVGITGALDIKVGAAIHGTITSSSDSLTLNARNTGNMLFQSGGSEKMKIFSNGSLTLNAYDAANQTGTATYLLGTDANGNVVKTTTVPSGSGGPFLPLAGGTMTGDLLINTTGGYFEVDVSDNSIKHADNTKAKFGTGNNFSIYHNGTDGYLKNETGDLLIPSGNVGIGTTSPTAKLDVYTAASFRADVATGNPLISIVNNTATSSTAGTATIKFTQANTQAGGKIISGRDGDYSGGAARSSNLQFYTSTAASDTEKMRITAAGNVGIGTTNPSARLDILTNSSTGDNSIDRHVRFRADNGEERFNFFVGRSGNSSNLQMYDSSEVVKVVLNTGDNSYFNGGNVGIGTASPASKLEVDGGDIEVDDSASGLILRSPDGTRYRVTVANGGTLSVAAV